MIYFLYVGLLLLRYSSVTHEDTQCFFNGICIGEVTCLSDATFTYVSCAADTDIPRLHDALFSDSYSSIFL